jgi:hypothetical protein
MLICVLQDASSNLTDVVVITHHVTPCLKKAITTLVYTMLHDQLLQSFDTPEADYAHAGLLVPFVVTLRETNYKGKETAS